MDLGPDLAVGDVVHPGQLELGSTTAVVEEGGEVVAKHVHFVSFRVIRHRTGQLWPLSGPESTTLGHPVELDLHVVEDELLDSYYRDQCLPPHLARIVKYY